MRKRLDLMSRTTVGVFVAFAPVCSSPLAADEVEPPRLSIPIACDPGKTCFIQSYVDVDPSPGAQDFACGSATYDGHKGTDFRVLSAAAARGVAVLAAADGTVRGLRDEMPDAFVSGPDEPAIRNRECGNGVVLAHEGGWETQYCHMRKGSVAVKVGDKVARGQRLGEVGYSGLAEFAHVHLETRRDGTVFDPFTGRSQAEACSREVAAATGLWTPEARSAFPYQNGNILWAGFAARPPTREELETNHVPGAPAPGGSELYFVVRIANIRVGDKVHLRLTGPGGFVYDNTSEPLPKNRQIHLAFASAKTRQGGQLPLGTYEGRAELMRGEVVIGNAFAQLRLGP